MKPTRTRCKLQSLDRTGFLADRCAWRTEAAPVMSEVVAGLFQWGSPRRGRPAPWKSTRSVLRGLAPGALRGHVDCVCVTRACRQRDHGPGPADVDTAHEVSGKMAATVASCNFIHGPIPDGCDACSARIDGMERAQTLLIARSRRCAADTNTLKRRGAITSSGKEASDAKTAVMQHLQIHRCLSAPIHADAFLERARDDDIFSHSARRLAFAACAP